MHSLSLRLARVFLASTLLLTALAPFTGAQESVHTIRRGFVSPITPEIKANLRAIKLHGDALGRAQGILGQWGDSISNSNAYLGALGSWGLITTRPADGHDYLPTLLWMGATANSADNPLHNFKGGNYCCESGWRVPNALAAIDDAIVRANPSWSLTMYGTNDIRQSGWNPATYDAQLERLIRINIDAGIVPVLSTIPPCVGWDTQVAEANTVIRAVAARLRIPLVDLHGVFMALHPADWASVLLGDGVHPSYLGGEGQLLETAHNAAGLLYQSDSGYNLRSMLTVDMAEKLRAIVFNNGSPDGTDLPILIASSPTHPVGSLVANFAPTFTFTHDSGPAPSGYSWTVDQNQWTTPDTSADTTATSVSTTIASAGTWYFHVRANSAAGWGPAAHYRVRISATPTLELRFDGGAASPHRDTFISANWGGNDNFGGAATLNVYNDGSTARSRGLFYFDVSGVSSAGLQSATLVLNIDGSQTSATPWDLFPVTSTWTEGTGNGNDNASGVTWATAPTYGATALATGSLPTGATTIEIDVTSAAQGWLANPPANYGVMFQHRSLYRSLYLIAREYGASELRPTLVLRYSTATDLEPPSIPTNLAGQIVNDNSAVLTWAAATDNVGVTGYRIYRSGTYLATSATTGYTDPGLPQATSFAYTVTAVDAAGNEGPATNALSLATPTPTLFAGADRTINLPAGTCLEAQFAGLDLSATLEWTQISGPAGARIVNPTNPHTAVYFDTGDDYTFRCTVTTGGATYTDDVVITVEDFPIRRRTVPVSTVAQLRAACTGARTNDIIQLADGLYDLTTVGNSSGGTWITLAGVSGVTLCSASDDPTTVTLRGNGFTDRSDNADGLWINTSSLITVRGITFEGFGAYAIKLEASAAPVPSDIRIEHCRFLEIGMRCIKGTIANTGDLVHRGWVKDCVFRNTALPPDRPGYSGDYIAGIDMMGLCNWEFADNEFDGVRGLTGGGRAGIFLWHETRGAVIERNFIHGCDRGIAFGNPSGTADVHASWSIARNNLIVMGRPDGISPDEPIELAQVEHVRIAHNTAWRASAAARGVRCSAFARDTAIANNIVRGQPTLDAGVTAHHNLFGDIPSAIFVNNTSGDFHLAATATTAIGQGAALAAVRADFDLVPRDATPDLGAFEFVAPPTSGVTALSAFYREGQTFLTWHEADAITGEAYRVYRSTQPISTANLASATRLAELPEGTARFKEMYTRQGVLLTSTDARVAPRIIARHVIQPMGPQLDEGTGLFVHTTHETAAGTYYYAITTVTDGVENLTLGSGNTTPGLAEVAAPIGAVPYVEYSGGSDSYVGYTMWMDHDLFKDCYLGYAMPFYLTTNAFTAGGATPSMHLDGHGTMPIGAAYYSNYGVGDVSHNGSYSPTWYFGMHENPSFDGTQAGGSSLAGPVANYMQYRIMQILLWSRRHYALDEHSFHIDGNSMGASGAYGFAMAFPKVVTSVWCNEGMTDYANTPTYAGDFAANYGSVALNNPVHLLPFADPAHPEYNWYLRFNGAGVYDFRDVAAFLAANVAEDFPLIASGHALNDGAIQFPTQGAHFETYIRNSRHCFSYHVSTGGHGWGQVQGAAMAGHTRTNESRPGFSNVPPKDVMRFNDYNYAQPMTDGNRGYLLNVIWGTADHPVAGRRIVETTTSWSLPIYLQLASHAPVGWDDSYTVDITPRNLQQLVVHPGDRFTYRIASIAGVVEAQGTITADADRLLLIPAVPIRVAGAIASVEYIGPAVPNTYTTWRSANFSGPDLSNDAISGPLADPDGAGVTNLQRYAFGLAARGPVANPVALGTADTPAGRVLTLTFPRRAAADDLSYILEASTDLALWTAVPDRTYTAGAGPITAQDAVALNTVGVTRRFLRLRITASP